MYNIYSDTSGPANFGSYGVPFGPGADMPLRAPETKQLSSPNYNNNSNNNDNFSSNSNGNGNGNGSSNNGAAPSFFQTGLNDFYPSYANDPFLGSAASTSSASSNNASFAGGSSYNVFNNNDTSNLNSLFSQSLNLSSSGSGAKPPQSQNQPSGPANLNAFNPLNSSFFNDYNPRPTPLNSQMQQNLQNSPQSPFTNSPLINPALGVNNNGSNNNLSAGLINDPTTRRHNSTFAPLSLTSSYSSDVSSGLGNFGSVQTSSSAGGFHLPSELQGGVSNINSRRPSYAAEAFNRSTSSRYNKFADLDTSDFNNNSDSIGENIALSAVASSMGGSDPLDLRSLASANNNNNFSGYSNDYKQSAPQTAPLNGGFNISSPASSSPFPSRFNYGGNNKFGQVPHSAVAASFNIPPESPFDRTRFRRSYSISAEPPLLSTPGPPAGGMNNNNGPVSINLDNGLLLVNNHIITSPELRAIYRKADKYFCVDTAEKVYHGIKALLDPMAMYAPKVSSLINFLKRKNDIGITSHSNLNKYKSLCLVCSKSGRIDVLIVSPNSNILLQKRDLVIVEGDRGKDLLHIIEPTVGLNFVVLLNFLKKREHLKSMGGVVPVSNYGDANHKRSGSGKSASMDIDDLTRLASSTASSSSTGSSNGSNSTANYVQDDENVILLPTKQVLRFASSNDVGQLPIKFKSEIIAFKIALEKLNQINMKSLSLSKRLGNGAGGNGGAQGIDSSKGPLNLKIFNSEYQFDKKKLIFYYSCDKRNDFRDLIKELFKIYKTRIWLCAVLNPDEFNPYSESNINSRRNLEAALKEFGAYLNNGGYFSTGSPMGMDAIQKLSVSSGAGSFSTNPQLFNPSIADPAQGNVFSSPSIDEYSLSNSYVILDSKNEDRRSSVSFISLSGATIDSAKQQEGNGSDENDTERNLEEQPRSKGQNKEPSEDPNMATLTSSPVQSSASLRQPSLHGRASAAVPITDPHTGNKIKAPGDKASAATKSAAENKGSLTATEQVNKIFNRNREQALKSKYQARINKLLNLDENNFKFEDVEVDDFHAQSLLNSIENLKIDLNLN